MRARAVKDHVLNFEIQSSRPALLQLRSRPKTKASFDAGLCLTRSVRITNASVRGSNNAKSAQPEGLEARYQGQYRGLRERSHAPRQPSLPIRPALAHHSSPPRAIVPDLIPAVVNGCARGLVFPQSKHEKHRSDNRHSVIAARIIEVKMKPTSGIVRAFASFISRYRRLAEKQELARNARKRPAASAARRQYARRRTPARSVQRLDAGHGAA
jgi:hypothetical protein